MKTITVPYCYLYSIVSLRYNLRLPQNILKIIFGKSHYSLAINVSVEEPGYKFFVKRLHF
jgi:hypothetical protein